MSMGFSWAVVLALLALLKPLELASATAWNRAVALPFTPAPANASTAAHAFAVHGARGINARTGQRIHADDRSLLIDAERWFPVAGEVQFSRLPRAQWHETLLRMRAGGLDGISMYVTWIHHEEQRGVLVFTGRRDLREFINQAGALGLKVLLRIGPWIHGEVRNGGHPDWLYAPKSENGTSRPPPCGKIEQLRTTDPAYMACALHWYKALAAELSGLFWSDGGPVWAVQLDNESRDLSYLLALQQLAVSAGITPAVFTKTGWPAPNTPYPPNYPLLPYFGGYADNFFNKAHRSAACTKCFEFPESLPGYKQVPGFPRLGIEIGAGMAASYAHRTHMEPNDMPAMHLVNVGAGFNGLGYYMYAGGNNPHSLVPRHDHYQPHLEHFGDYPNETLQESSFQLRTLGQPNPMPSESYDFFAPLGEFGQPRPHYHSMRRLHQFVTSRDHGWGRSLADTTAFVVANQSSSLRWMVRSGGAQRASFLFINNYQRATKLPSQFSQRFDLQWSSSEEGNVSSRLQIPSNNSDPIDVLPGVWFVWPVRVPLLPAGTTPARIEWATAQLITRVNIAQSHHVIFLSQTRGVKTEIAIGGVSGKDVSHQQPGATLSTETTDDGDTVHVLRGAHPDSSYVPVMTVQVETTTVSFVLMTDDEADRMYTDTAMNDTRVFLTASYSHQNLDVASGGDDIRDIVLSDGKSWYLRHYSIATSLVEAGVETTEVFVCPGLSNTHIGNAMPKPVFSRLQVKLPRVDGVHIPYSVTLVRPAPMPPREVPLAPSGKPKEPTMDDWLSGAAIYNITIPPARFNIKSADDYAELRVAIDYEADAARLYSPRGKLLTDNWFSGYTADGRMEVGLTFLASENPGMSMSANSSQGFNLTLFVLPLKKETLEKKVWLQTQYWPSFAQQNGTVALHVADVRPIVIVGTKLAL